MSGRRGRILGALAAVALAAGIAVAVLGGGGSGSRPEAAEIEVGQDIPEPECCSFNRGDWKNTDFSKHSVPLTEFRAGGPHRDGIPPIDDPRAISQQRAERFLDDREPVMVVEQGRAVRAYPIQILLWHEIANDRLGGRPIAVTFCPLCNSAVVFDRRVDGRTLTFGTTGNLRKSDLVMWDRQTESWWQQFSGEAVVGELTGKRLRMLPTQTLSWGDFKRMHPDGDVLARDELNPRPYGENPYLGYDSEEQPFLFEGKTDDRLPAKERVVAVFGKGETVVVPFSRLAREPVVELDVASRPAVVFYKRGVVSPLDEKSVAEGADVGTAAAFDRRLGRRTLSFEPRGDGYADRETGSTWDIGGTAVDGPLKGRRLRSLRHDQQFWFALAAFVPDARVLAR